MAGGNGVRIWPVSRNAKPKQFLDVADTGKTFIQSTFERFSKIVPKENIIIVTGDRYRHLVAEQLPDVAPENILFEPYSRSTAPCIAYATYTLLKRDPEAKMVVTPSDHLIEDEDIFVQTIENAFDYIDGNDVLMTLGVVPTRPDTNYGYIQACGGSEAYKQGVPLQVKTFTEKPDRDLAQVFINTGEFFWNAGIFIWKAQTIRQEMEKHLPEVTKLFNGWENALGTAVESEFITRAYTDCANISIDYGVMEKAENIWVLAGAFGWDDVGSWLAVERFNERDENGNVIRGDFITVHTQNCILQGRDKLIATVGVKDLIVVDAGDALLICRKDSAGDIKKVLENLKESKRMEYV